MHSTIIGITHICHHGTLPPIFFLPFFEVSTTLKKGNPDILRDEHLPAESTSAHLPFIQEQKAQVYTQYYIVLWG